MKAALIFLVAGGFGFSAYWAVGQTDHGEAAVHPAREAYVAPLHFVDLNVLVMGRDKYPVSGLGAAAFQVSEDGAPRTVQSVRSADGPISLCLVIDESGSTKAMRRPIGDAAVALVNGLPPGSEAMVVHFADRAFLDMPFTPVASVDETKLRQMESRGGTALFDAVVAAEESMVVRARQKRRALVIISDGGDNASTLSLEQAVPRISVPGAPLLYVLGFSDDQDSSSQHFRNEETLKTLTKAGGGVTFTAKNAVQMTGMAEQISDMIGSQVVISFASADAARSGRWHKLDVRIAGDKHEVVHAPPGLFLRGPGAGNGSN